MANPGVSVATAFNLTQDKGAIVIRPTAKSAGQFMQYGILPKVQFDIYKTNPAGTTNINWGFLLPQKAHQFGKFEDLVEASADLGAVASTIYTWNFDIQKPNMVTIMNYKPFGNLPKLRPLMFIKINPKMTYTWK